MMYFKILREGITELPSAHAHLRDELEQAARSEGWPAMHSRLKLLDPVTAAKFNQVIVSEFNVHWKSAI